MGNWEAGRKHGKGRYVFTNGDFYDGDFFADNATGVGVYRLHIPSTSFLWNPGTILKEMKNKV